MNKTFKKLLTAVLSLAMVAGSIVVPTAASADGYTPLVAGDTVLNEWKFDFGAAGQTPDEGFTAVAPDRNYVTTKDYGFVGIDEESYKLGNRYDGFGTQKGQVINLTAGGTGANDAIGATGEDLFGNAMDVYYPTRFALAAPDETYYRVKATVTTLDATKDAEISLYTERKHPIFTDTTVKAGETKTVTFSVRPTPIYYEKSEPKGTIADNMVNVCVAGTNSAIASIEIQQVEPYPVFWVLGDSTVTDGNCSLPFFRQQNYTGVGTGLTKYLPSDIAMVNEGEGGLNAADNYHFNMVKSRIKAGDYLYVEYGHNHKDDGPTGYVANLNKYYNTCHDAGAKLIIVSPIERINTFTDGAYQHTLRGFAEAGEAYVAEKVAGGATDIAYVDLNQYSLDFYNKITTDNDGNANAIKFYFQTGKGGSTDQTHPNDSGAENLAYEFIKAAKAVTDTTQKAVLDGFLSKLTDETPNLVSEDITSGKLGGDGWPTYVVPTDNEYPVVIENIDVDDNGSVTSARVKVQDAKFKMSAYGIIVITVKDEDGNEKGKIYAVDQVDNSTGNGKQTIKNFRGDVKIGDTDTYSAIVMQAKDVGGDTGLIVDEDANVAYSAVYTPAEIVKYLIDNEDHDTFENFEYYGAVYEGDEPSSLSSFNDWTHVGSGGATLTLGETADFKYANVITDGAKNGAANQGSFYLWKNFVTDDETEKTTNIGTSGKYMISADMKFLNGGGMNVRLSTGNSNNSPGGTASLLAFAIGTDGKVTCGGQEAGQISATEFSKVKYVLDMDLGTATISVGGGSEVTVPVDNYNTFQTEIAPASLTAFMFESNKVAVGIQVANLEVAQLRRDKLPQKTLSYGASNDEWGTVKLVKPAEDTQEELMDVIPGAPALSYDGENAIVSTGSGLGAVLIEAVYDGNVLKSVKSTPVVIEGAGSKSIPAAVGSKLMLWESLDGMRPCLDAIIAEEPEPEVNLTDFTAQINTEVTLLATPNEGYAFMEWLDKNGAQLSTDAEYTFRLHDTRTAIARFAKEPAVSDVTSFDIAPETANIKFKSGATTKMVVSNAKDAKGTPCSKITNTDFTWSCDDTGIEVSAEGTVTLTDAFSLGGNATKTVKVKAALNGVEKTADIVIFGYEYYEEMSSSSDYDGLVMTIGGRDAIVFPGASTTQHYKMANSVALDAPTTVEFDNAWSGQNTCGQLRTLQFKNSAGTTIFSVAYSWDGMKVDSTDLAAVIAKDTWSTVKVEIDPETKVVKVTAGGNSAETTLADDAGDIAGIDFVSAASVPGPEARSLGISKIVISK